MSQEKLKPLYIISIAGDDVGEVEGAFDEHGELLSWWALNDATWRHEYFENLLNKLGYTCRKKPPKNYDLETVLEEAAMESLF